MQIERCLPELELHATAHDQGADGSTAARIWGWAASRRRPDLTEKLARRLEDDTIATCVPVILEALHRARTGSDYTRLYEDVFAPLRRLPLDEAASERALEVQRALGSPSPIVAQFGAGGCGTGYRVDALVGGVHYHGLIGPLIEAVKELDARLRAVEERA